MNRKQNPEHIKSRVLARIKNNSYSGQNKGNKGTNFKPNSGSFKKGIIPYNKGLKKWIDLEYCKNKYLEGYSCFYLGDKFNVSEATIRNRFKEAGFKLRKNNDHSKITKEKIKNTLKEKGIQPKIKNRKAWNKGIPAKPKERLRLKAMRSKQIFPKKDSSIEIKMQNLLKQLGIEFYTHLYIKEIEHGYQCDIFVPKQEGVIKNTIIECFGNYWHNYPYGRDIDIQRCIELRNQGYRVLAVWENEIKLMELNDLKVKL